MKYHSGQKPACTLYLSDSDYIATAGSNKVYNNAIMMFNLYNFYLLRWEKLSLSCGILKTLSNLNTDTVLAHLVQGLLS